MGRVGAYVASWRESERSHKTKSQSISSSRAKLLVRYKTVIMQRAAQFWSLQQSLESCARWKLFAAGGALRYSTPKIWCLD